MKRKSQSTTSKFTGFLYPAGAVALLLAVWQGVSMTGWIPGYMLPSPVDICRAFVNDFSNLMGHARVTLTEAFIGLFLGVVTGFVTAVIMDHFPLVKKSVYPLIILTQTIPTVAIAPLLVLWFGYEMTPKIILIVIATFFPVAVGMYDGFQSADPDAIHLLRSMGAGRLAIFRHIKLPGAMTNFFSSLRISAAYSVVGAVISEWLGGFNGLGVYMTRVKKSFSFDKMFAVIFLISAISLALMALVDLAQKWSMPWERAGKKQSVQHTKKGR